MTKKKPAPKKRKAGRPSLYAEALAANSGETEPMAILKNARHERFAQNLAKGMSATAAYEKAGYKPNDQNAARLTRNDEVRSRVAELMAPAIEATTTPGQS